MGVGLTDSSSIEKKCSCSTYTPRAGRKRDSGKGTMGLTIDTSAERLSLQRPPPERLLQRQKKTCARPICHFCCDVSPQQRTCRTNAAKLKAGGRVRSVGELHERTPFHRGSAADRSGHSCWRLGQRLRHGQSRDRCEDQGQGRYELRLTDREWPGCERGTNCGQLRCKGEENRLFPIWEPECVEDPD